MIGGRVLALSACCLLLAAGVFAPLSFDTQIVELGGLQYDTQLIDVTGDGYDDLVTMRAFPPTVVVAPNLGDGVLGEALPPFVSLDAWSMSLADANADGLADLLEVSSLYQSGVRVYLAQGDGSFALQGDFGVHTEGNEALLAELNGDGILDLVVTAGEGITCCAVYTLLGAGDGSFLPGWKGLPFNYSGAFGEPLQHLRPMAAGDLDGDGHTDLALGPYVGQLFWLRGTPGLTTFSSGGPLPSRPDGYVTVDLADLDNDGDLDVVSRAVISGSSSGPIAGFLNDASGHFAEPVLSSHGGNAPWHNELADVDLDGWTDFVGHDFDGVGFVASGLGDGGFAGSRPLHDVVDYVRDVAVGDVNGDGLPDLAALVGSPERALVLTNTGDGPVLPAVGQGLAGAMATPRLIGVGDLAPNSPLELRLSCAAPGAMPGLFVGASASWLPFKAGVLVPSPEALVLGPLVNAEGLHTWHFRWPSGVPSEATFWMQSWIVDPSAPSGFSASNAVRASSAKR